MENNEQNFKDSNNENKTNKLKFRIENNLIFQRKKRVPYTGRIVYIQNNLIY